MQCNNCQLLTQRCMQAGELGRALLQENSALKEALDAQQQQGGVDQSDAIQKLKSQLSASEESYNRLLLDISNSEQENVALRQQLQLMKKQRDSGGPDSPTVQGDADAIDILGMKQKLASVTEERDDALERAAAAEQQRDEAIDQLVDQKLSSVAIEAKVASLSNELVSRVNAEAWVMAELDVQSPHTLLSKHRDFLTSIGNDKDNLIAQILAMVEQIRVKNLKASGEEEMTLLNSVEPSALYLLLALASQQSLANAEKRILEQERTERELEEALTVAKEHSGLHADGRQFIGGTNANNGDAESLLGVAQALDFQDGDEAVRLASEQLLLAQIKKGEQVNAEMQSEMQLLKRQTHVLLRELQLARDQRNIAGLEFLTPNERQSLLALIVEVTQERLWTALSEIKEYKDPTRI